MRGDDLEKELRDAYGYPDEPDPKEGRLISALALASVCLFAGMAIGAVLLSVRV